MYRETYDNLNIRNNNYCIIEYIKEYYKPDYLCLDLGCGSCRKIKQIANKVNCYYAIDCDPTRINLAEQNGIKDYNIKVGVGDNFYLPFRDGEFDLVSGFMTKYSVCETSRVLKNNGIFIIETLGADDKRDIKYKFGKDQFGWRGRMLYDSTDKQLNRIKESMFPFFKIEKEYRICFETSIKANELSELFQMTNEIRCFDKNRDDCIIQSLKNDNGYIKFNEERLIIVGRKR